MILNPSVSKLHKNNEVIGKKNENRFCRSYLVTSIATKIWEQLGS